MKKANIAVLVSGGGTNLQALIDAEKSGILKSGSICAVISSKAGAYALTRAENAGIKTYTVARKECADRQDFEKKLLAILEAENTDLIVLAGFMTVLSADFISHYPLRIINVHPALIPSFCGDGYYGLKVHEEALKYGVKVTGATVHYVIEKTDAGPIIMQKAVDVLDGDSPESLQRRVMEQAEWILLPRAAELVSAKILSENADKEIL